MPRADVVQCRGSIRLLGNAFVLVQRWSPGGAYGEASDHEGARRRNLCMSLGLFAFEKEHRPAHERSPLSVLGICGPNSLSGLSDLKATPLARLA
jgi:hypothetical protein